MKYCTRRLCRVPWWAWTATCVGLSSLRIFVGLRIAIHISILILTNFRYVGDTISECIYIYINASTRFIECFSLACQIQYPLNVRLLQLLSTTWGIHWRQKGVLHSIPQVRTFCFLSYLDFFSTSIPFFFLLVSKKNGILFSNVLLFGGQFVSRSSRHQLKTRTFSASGKAPSPAGGVGIGLTLKRSLGASPAPIQ